MSQMIVYLKSQQVYKPINEVEDKSDMMNISGTELRNMLVNREKIPEWFTFPEISQELYNDYLPNSKKGLGIRHCSIKDFHEKKFTEADIDMTKLLEHLKVFYLRHDKLEKEKIKQETLY